MGPYRRRLAEPRGLLTAETVIRPQFTYIALFLGVKSLGFIGLCRYSTAL